MTRFVSYAAVLLAGAGMMAATPALAQVRNLDNEASDVRVYQGRVDGAPAVFEVTVPRDTSLRIDVMTTSELDPVVRVIDARSGDLIVEDDDGGEGLNSRATVSGEARGRRVRIEVDSFDAEWSEGESYGGAFDLRLSTRSFEAVGVRPVTYGGTQTGTLMGEPHQFTFQGRAGQMVEIALIATDGELDPYLELHDASGETVAFNDDGGGELNSLLRHTFTDSGTYTIVATGFGDSEGAYRLRVREQREAMAQLPVQQIGIEDIASGELASSWDNGDALVLSHIDYQLSDAAKAAILAGNGAVTIRMNASGEGDADFGGAIDPYVELGFETPLGFAVVDSDDDGAGDLNSLLPVDLGLLADNPGMLDMLRIRAQGYGGSSGAYTLEITPGMEARAEYTYDEAAIEEAMEAIMEAAED